MNPFLPRSLCRVPLLQAGLVRAVRGTAVLALAVALVGCGSEAPQPGMEAGPAGTSSGAPATTGGGSESVTTPALEPPPDIPGSWEPVIGEYAQGPDTVSIMEDGQELKYLRWNGGRSIARLENDTTLDVNGIDSPVILRRDGPGGAGDGSASASVTALVVDGRVLSRLGFGAEGGRTFRIDPVRPVEELRPEALAATPPREEGDFRESELVELTSLDPTIELDVRYATDDNFMGTSFYESPRAFLQRPAAEALVRAHRWLGTQGYGVMVFDGYRPWHVTKMFWDATPDSLKGFVANPASGSRHNRGGAVDLTLYDLETGEPVDMPTGYDEFSPRAYSFYRGGTMRERWFRRLLRIAMESEGFAVYESEWWHFDHEDWRHYRIQNDRFEEIVTD